MATGANLVIAGCAALGRLGKAWHPRSPALAAKEINTACLGPASAAALAPQTQSPTRVTPTAVSAEESFVHPTTGYLALVLTFENSLSQHSRSMM